LANKNHLRMVPGVGAGAGTGAGTGPQSSPGLTELDVVPGDSLSNVENDEDPPVIDTNVPPPFEHPVLEGSEFPVKAVANCSSDNEFAAATSGGCTSASVVINPDRVLIFIGVGCSWVGFPNSCCSTTAGVLNPNRALFGCSRVGFPNSCLYERQEAVNNNAEDAWNSISNSEMRHLYYLQSPPVAILALCEDFAACSVPGNLLDHGSLAQTMGAGTTATNDSSSLDRTMMDDG
jgi:hypothetical protein